MTAGNPKKPGMGLSGKILLGMVLGIPVGIFFGEEVAFLNFLGEAYVQLLQVSILPFVLVSLIVGLGKLNYDQALALAKKGGLLLGLLWLLGLVIVAVMPLSYPNWESVSFFVPSLVEDHRRDDYSSWEAARALDAPRIGLPTKSRYYASFAKELLPQAKFVKVESS